MPASDIERRNGCWCGHCEIGVAIAKAQHPRGRWQDLHQPEPRRRLRSPPDCSHSPPPSLLRRRRLAETVLRLFDPIGSRRDNLPCFAVVRWLSYNGRSNVLLFGPEDRPGRRDDDEQETRGGITDVIEHYTDHRFLRSEWFGELHSSTSQRR